MRKAILASLAVPATLFGAAPALAADDAFNSQGLRKAVTLEGVREHQAALQGIANANGGNRAAGLPGYDKSVEYVEAKLRAAGYTPRRHAFQFTFTRDESTLRRVAPAPEQSWTPPNEFKAFLESPKAEMTDDVTAVAVNDATDPGCQPEDFTSAVSGNIALIRRGGCFFSIKVNNALAAGATGVLIGDNGAGIGNNLTIGAIATDKPLLIANKAVADTLFADAAKGGLRLAMKANRVSEQRTTHNVIAETSGDADRTVVVGAHLDSVQAGPGINDNGSGTAGVLEIAEQYAARGLEPRNRIRFMWFGAEELGLLGSRAYVASLSEAERKQILLKLNFDMIGSPNGARFVYDGDNSAFPVGPGAAKGPDGSGLIEAVFVDHFRNQGLPSAPTPFSGRSDYGPFIEQGIPAGGLFTGAEGLCGPEHAKLFGCTEKVAFDPCYHAACDTYANNDDAMLHSMADAAAHATYTFGLTKEAVVNGGVLRPGTETPNGDNDGDGTDEGGGLHPPHDHDHEETEDH